MEIKNNIQRERSTSKKRMNYKELYTFLLIYLIQIRYSI